MGEIGRRTGREQSGDGQRRVPLLEMAREALWDALVISGLQSAQEQLEAERTFRKVAGHRALATFEAALRAPDWPARLARFVTLRARYLLYQPAIAPSLPPTPPHRIATPKGNGANRRTTPIAR